MAGVGLKRGRLVAHFRQNLFHALLCEGPRSTRVLVCSVGEEMLDKVPSPMSRCSAGAHMPGDGEGPEREHEKAENRDGKEDIHAP
jgi:hypothetical protein